MKPVHLKYSDLETLVFPEAITLKIILSGFQTNGSHAIFEDNRGIWCWSRKTHTS